MDYQWITSGGQYGDGYLWVWIVMVIDISLSQRLMVVGTYGYDGYLWVMVHRQYGYGYLQCDSMRRGIVFPC